MIGPLVGKSHWCYFAQLFTSIAYKLCRHKLTTLGTPQQRIRAYIFRDWQVRHYFFCELKNSWKSFWQPMRHYFFCELKTHESRFGNEKVSCSHIEVLYTLINVAFKVEILIPSQKKISQHHFLNWNPAYMYCRCQSPKYENRF